MARPGQAGGASRPSQEAAKGEEGRPPTPLASPEKLRGSRLNATSCAGLEMRACRAARLLLLLLLWLQGGRPDPSAEAAPGAPERVRLVARTFQHLLLWAPAASRSPGPRLVLYDVQYKRYGNHSWTPVGRCTAIARLDCDLTAETAEPAHRYFARVRALDAHGTPSHWTATAPFSPKEATLRLWKVNLSLSGNILRVTLELPVHRGQQATIAHEDLHPGGWEQYRVYVRRASSNDQYLLVKTNRTFDLPALVWGERYCVSVEPYLPSRPNPATRTEEQCVSTPPLKDSAQARAILSVALFILVALGGVAAAQVWAHLKKPMETPSVLNSFQKQTSSPRPLGMRGVDLCLEVESTHQISMGVKDPSQTHPSSVSLSSGAPVWRVPGQARPCLPEALASSRAESVQLRDLSDSGTFSSSSSDSGICLQAPLSSCSLLLRLLEEPRGPLLRSDWEDGGRGVEERFSLGAGAEEAQEQGEPPPAQLPGYQRQAGPPQEALGSFSCLPNSEGIAPSRPVLGSGYLKQASVATPSTLGPWALAHHERLNFLSGVGPGGLGVLAGPA
uniref:Uncharacterized protein n=2 Tax=Sphaerodactylus townsendi TaxID=933632 RepID=A0ACB8EZ02_9SAUR